MSMENEVVVAAEEKEPVYYTPKTVNLISDISSILSWVVLVGYIGYVIVQVVNLNAQMVSQSMKLADLMKEPSFIAYLFTNIITPLLTGLVFFTVLQAAANALNVLLEMDFNAREAKSK